MEARMNIGKFVLLTATFMLAMALTFSCSSGDDPEDNNSGGGGNNNDPFADIPRWEEYKEYFKYYDPDDEEQRCRNGVVEERCEDDGREIWYSPLTHSCGHIGLCDTDVCEDIYYFGKLERCGNALYAYSHERCQNGVLEYKCGDVWYNPETHECHHSNGNEMPKAKERCGSKYYEPNSDTRCQNEIIQERCGYGENETWYNSETHYCYCSNGPDAPNWNGEPVTCTAKAKEFCKGRYLDGDYERCNNGVVESKCGENATWYNIITQSCDWKTGMVKAKLRCGS
jgi:hypothetical protein